MISKVCIKDDMVRERLNDAIGLIVKVDGKFTLEDVEHLVCDTYNSTVMAMEHLLNDKM